MTVTTAPAHQPATALAYPPAEAAKMLGISRSRLYELLREGRLRARKVGAKTLVPHAELVRYLDELPAWTPEDERPETSALGRKREVDRTAGAVGSGSA